MVFNDYHGAQDAVERAQEYMPSLIGSPLHITLTFCEALIAFQIGSRRKTKRDSFRLHKLVPALRAGQKEPRKQLATLKSWAKIHLLQYQKPHWLKRSYSGIAANTMRHLSTTSALHRRHETLGWLMMKPLRTSLRPDAVMSVVAETSQSSLRAAPIRPTHAGVRLQRSMPWKKSTAACCGKWARVTAN